MILKHEEDGMAAFSEYQDGIMKFHEKHTCTLDVWADELLASFGARKMNPTVYLTM